MTTEKLLFIKNAQRDYKEKFGEILYIDFPKTSGVPTEPTSDYTRKKFPIAKVRAELRAICKKHGTTIDNIASIKGSRSNKHRKEISALTEYSIFIYQNKYDPRSAGELVGKNRTTLLYHYNRSLGKQKYKTVNESKRERKTDTDQLAQDS